MMDDFGLMNGAKVAEGEKLFSEWNGQAIPAQMMMLLVMTMRLNGMEEHKDEQTSNNHPFQEHTLTSAFAHLRAVPWL